MAPRRLFELFYSATPLFAVADLALGVPARAAGIPDPGLRMGYYVMLLGCWLLCRKAPASAPFVGLCESTVNLTILLLSILLPVWSAGDLVLAGGGGPLYGPGVWWNFIISGPMLVLAIKSNERTILMRYGPGRGRR